MNTGDWRAFNATDRHTSDVLLAQPDTGRKVQRENTHEGKTDRKRKIERRETEGSHTNTSYQISSSWFAFF